MYRIWNGIESQECGQHRHDHSDSHSNPGFQPHQSPLDAVSFAQLSLLMEPALLAPFHTYLLEFRNQAITSPNPVARCVQIEALAVKETLLYISQHHGVLS